MSAGGGVDVKEIHNIASCVQTYLAVAGGLQNRLVAPTATLVAGTQNVEPLNVKPYVAAVWSDPYWLMAWKNCLEAAMLVVPA
jgi:hypothetical protein